MAKNKEATLDGLQLIAITQEGKLANPVESVPSLAAQIMEATTQLYKAVGYERHWVGYLALENGSFVGSCAFKSPLERSRDSFGSHFRLPLSPLVRKPYLFLTARVCTSRRIW